MLTRRALAAGAAALPFAANAQAQTQADFPTRPIRLVIPFAAGGSINGLARMAIEQLNRVSPQPFVADNRPGAGGTIAAEHVARAAPDGYTLIFATVGTLLLHRYLHPGLSYDPRRAFAPIGMVSETPYVLVAHRSLPATLAEVMAQARARPEGVTYASTGAGSMPNLLAERLGELANAQMLHVLYGGASQMSADLIAGRAGMTFEAVVNAIPLIEGGTMRALAVTSGSRVPQLPDTPTMAEAGFPDLTVTLWTSIAAPAATPQPVQARLATMLTQALSQPGTAEAFGRFGVQPSLQTPEAFRALLAREDELWRATAERVARTIR
jgi:tripartite-type tricarboxylate transporter receptor subunit TctC